MDVVQVTSDFLDSKVNDDGFNNVANFLAMVEDYKYQILMAELNEEINS
jgi:hypothetical protein